MAQAQMPFGLFPVGHAAAWHRPGSGGYLLYRGLHTAAGIDWATPVGMAQAGGAGAYDRAAALVADTEYWYGLRAVSDAGVPEDGTAAVCRLAVSGAGVLAGSRPNAVQSARAWASAGGAVAWLFAYSRTGEKNAATAVQIARRAADGSWPWGAPLESVALRSSGLGRYSGSLGPFAHGETVELAMRAVTAAGVAGPASILPAVAADSEAPADLEYLEAVQI